MPDRVIHVATALLLSAACAPAGRREPAPILIDSTPRLISFGAPVQGTGLAREICLVGDTASVAAVLPGGVAILHAVLVSVEGVRDSLRAPTIERRGMDTVCLSQRGTSGGQSNAEPLTYLGVELTSTSPVVLREVRWWVGERGKP